MVFPLYCNISHAVRLAFFRGDSNADLGIEASFGCRSDIEDVSALAPLSHWVQCSPWGSGVPMAFFPQCSSCHSPLASLRGKASWAHACIGKTNGVPVSRELAKQGSQRLGWGEWVGEVSVPFVSVCLSPLLTKPKQTVSNSTNCRNMKINK